MKETSINLMSQSSMKLYSYAIFITANASGLITCNATLSLKLISVMFSLLLDKLSTTKSGVPTFWIKKFENTPNPM